MSSTRPVWPVRVFASVVVALVAGSSSAQAPSPWADLHRPGTIGPPQFAMSEKLVAHRVGSLLFVFSAVTGKWHQLTISFGTSFQVTADLLLTPESDRWTAFSAYRGVAVPVFVPFASATMVPASSVALVIDAGQVHAFSAFTGAWSSRALPAGWTWNVYERIVVISGPQGGGGGASAFDAYHGQWVDLPAQNAAPAAVRLAGASAVVDFAGTMHGFSATHGAWTDTATSQSSLTASNAALNDLVWMRDRVFSGVTGHFRTSPLATFTTHGVTGFAATVGDASQTFVGGAARDTWTALPAGAVGPYGQATGGVLFHSPGIAHAYSVATDTIASTPNTFSLQGTYARGCTIVVQYGVPQVHSLLTGQWYAFPPIPGFITIPQNSELGAAVAMSGGFKGFSSWSGNWVDGTAWPAAYYLDGSELLARASTQTLYAFDPIRSRWSSSPWAQTLSRDDATSAHVLAAVDDNHAIGFNTHTGAMTAVNLPEPSLGVWAQGHVGAVSTEDHVLAYSGYGEVVAWHGFPFDRAAVAIGTATTLQCRVPTGGFVVMGLGPAAPAPVPLPFGDLWLDLPNTATVVLTAPPGESRALLPLAIPMVPSLRNSAWFAQALTIPATGTPWLGSAMALRVL